jgi:serine/threonine protein phosphatase 1
MVPSDRPGRLFVCGDIHGCLEQLLAALDAVAFDRERDTLWALGDLVDRGPDSPGVLALLDEPWFFSIKGNHEVMAEAAFDGSHEDSAFHVRFGGAWFAQLDEPARAAAIAKIRDLPVMATLVSPSGRKVGLVHADVPFGDWGQFEQWKGTQRVADTAMWSRGSIDQIRGGQASQVPWVQGIDQVFLGHTPVERPLRHANMRFIDTGACFEGGYLTLEEVA